MRYADRVQRAAIVRGAHGPEEHPGHHLGGDGIFLDFFGCESVFFYVRETSGRSSDPSAAGWFGDSDEKKKG
jgi:hypothetical protein